MACPVCGKRIQGENVLWTHVVFKHPDKADNLVLDKPGVENQENQENKQSFPKTRKTNQENKQPFSKTESQANVGATKRLQLQKGKKEKGAKTSLNEVVKTRKRTKEKISSESETAPKKRVKRTGKIWEDEEKKVGKGVLKESRANVEVDKEATEENDLKLDKEVAKKINIEVDEGILDLLMEQKTNEMLEEHIKSLENYVEKIFDNLESHKNQERLFDKDHLGELEIDKVLENANNQIPEKTVTSPQKRRRITILTPLEKKTTLSTASQRKRTLSSASQRKQTCSTPKRKSLASAGSGVLHTNMVTLIM